MLTEDTIKEMFYYKDGKLYYNSTDKEVGYLNRTDNYHRFDLNGKRYLTSRIIWCFHMGKFPDRPLIYKDGNSANIEINNLEEQVNFKGIKKEDLTSNLLDKIFRYDPSTGELFYKQVSSNRVKIGSKVGKPSKSHGYLNVGLGNLKMLLVHKLILTMNGVEIPDDMEVDHKDGDRTNNKLNNLRVVTHGINMKNRKIGSNNTSGYFGIRILNSGRFSCKITSEGVENNLGTVDTFEEALIIRKKAEKELNFSENHGRKII